MSQRPLRTPGCAHRLHRNTHYLSGRLRESPNIHSDSDLDDAVVDEGALVGAAGGALEVVAVELELYG